MREVRDHIDIKNESIVVHSHCTLLVKLTKMCALAWAVNAISRKKDHKRETAQNYIKIVIVGGKNEIVRQ